MKPVFIISRKGATDRRKTLHDRFTKGGITKYTIVDAYEPSVENDEIIKQFTNKRWIHDPRLKNMEKNEARKACYLSHVVLLQALYNEGINSAIICEDDIFFKQNIIEPIMSSPKDSLINYFDNTLVEVIDKVSFEKNQGYIEIDKRFKVWCLGMVEYNDIKKTLQIIKSQTPKVVDSIHCNHIQRNYPCFLCSTDDIKQDRKTFESSIK